MRVCLWISSAQNTLHMISVRHQELSKDQHSQGGHITAASPSGDKAEDGQSPQLAHMGLTGVLLCRTQLREQLLILRTLVSEFHWTFWILLIEL